MVEGGWIGVGGDGVVEVGYEAGNAASQEGEMSESVGVVDGLQPMGPGAVHVDEGFEVSPGEALVEDEGPEGVGEQAAGTVGIAPVDTGGGDGVAGGAAHGR